MLAKSSPWHGRKYFLDKMTLGDLVVAFFTHHSILVYLTLAALGAGYAVAAATGWRGPTPGRARRGPALPVRRVRAASLGAAQPPALQERAHRQGLEADPLRPSPEPARPLGAVRRALHHPAADPAAHPADRLVDRRRGRRRGRHGHRGPDLRRLRVLPLRPAPAVHAPEQLAARDQEAPPRPPLPQRAGQFRHHAGHLGQDPGHRLRQPARGAAQRDHPQSRLRPTPSASRYPWVGELSASDDEYAVLRTKRAVSPST